MADAFNAGRYNHAITRGEEALRLIEENPGVSQFSDVMLLNNIGAIYMAKGNFLSTEKCFIESLERQEKKEPRDVGGLLECVRVLQVFYRQMHHAEKVKQYLEYEVCLRRNENFGSKEELAYLMNQLGGICLEMRDYDSAEEYFEESKALNIDLHGKDDAIIASILFNVANVHVEREDYAEAEKALGEAVDISKKLLFMDDKLVSILNLQGEIWRRTKKFDKSEAAYKEALGIIERVHPSNLEKKAMLINGMCVLRFEQGRYAEAKELCEQTIANCERLFGKDHMRVALSLENMALLFIEWKQYEEAEIYYERANKIFGKNIPALSSLWGIYEKNMGRIMLGQKKYDEAEARFLKSIEIIDKAEEEMSEDLKMSLEGLVKVHEMKGDEQKVGLYKARLEKIELEKEEKK